MADDDVKLDEYGDFEVGAGGDVVIVDDMDALMQDIRHRVMTVKGSLVEDEDYGGNLPLYLHMEDTATNRRALRNELLTELAKEERILPQRTDVIIRRWNRETVIVLITFVRKTDLATGAVEAEAA